jgi:hypothetical protein
LRIFAHPRSSMRLDQLKDLKDKQILSEEQYSRLEPIYSRNIISVFYELRIILYLGVMVFTTGTGILIYKNIGDLGHLALIGVLLTLTAWCFQYALKHAPVYKNTRITSPTPLFDYVVLLGCLLFISVLGYLQVQYELFDDGMGLTTLLTAVFFFFFAYRFDHLGVLSLAITALASFWSISISPQKWYSGNFLSESNLHITAILFGAVLSSIAIYLDRKSIKNHFTFTYLNFCSLIFLTGALAGLFMDDRLFILYLLLLYAGCALLAFYAHQKKSFLFILYAVVFAYIGTTYILTDFIDDVPELWFLYLLASCGAFIVFIIRYKSFFKRAA